MVEADAVERVFQGNHPLDFVGHDHRVQHRAHRQRCVAIGHALLRQVIRHGKDPAEVIRGMPPFGGEPGVVVVEPAHDATDVPGRLDRVQAKRRARHPRTERHHSALDNRPQVLGALGEAQGQQAATQRVHQTVAGGVEGGLGVDAVVEDVVGNVLQDLVVVGAVVLVDVGAHGRSPKMGGVNPRANGYGKQILDACLLE
jgi:hypothetical protein